MTVDDLNRQIKSGTLHGIYLFYGKEQYLIDKRLEAIANKLISPGTEALNIFKFGKGTSIDEILSAADRFPQLSPIKLIIVRDSGILDNALTAEFKALRAAAEHFPQDTCLIFTELEFDKKKLKNIDFIATGGGIVNFEYIPLNKLTIWVTEQFKKCGKSISEGDASYIISLCGQSLGRLKSECDKLQIYMGDKVKLTREDIDSVVSKSAEFRVYDMLENAVAGKGRTAQIQLKYLRDSKEEPIYILSLMMSRLSELLMCRLLKEDGLTTDEISGYFDFKRPAFAVNKIIGESRRFNEYDLKNIINKGLLYDIDCKSGRLEPWAAVEMYLSELLNMQKH